MIVQKTDGRLGRMVLVGMATTRVVLGPVAVRWERGLFASRWENLVGGWCVEHYHRYKKAPGRAIQGYFDRWAESGKDADTVRLVESFLASLSEELAEIRRTVSPEYVLDQAAVLFNRVKLANLRDELDGDLEVGDVAKAKSRVQEWREVEVGGGVGVNVLSDREAVLSAFDRREPNLIDYPDAAGQFFDGALEADAFIGFMGKEKVGKSFWLQDIVYRGVRQNRNTAYFQCGDMSQNQVLRRLAARAAKRPYKADRRVRLPVGIEPGTPPEVRYDERAFPTDMTGDEAADALEGVGANVGGDRLKLSTHAAGSVSVRGMESILDGWVRDGWVPDVIVVDYADLLAPIDPKAVKRDQINDTWMALRGVSQRYHCLVVTATQTDADSYNTRLLSRENFSEDKRKFAHVTGMVGINQIDSEKEDQIYRLNWILLRELEFSETRQLWCAGCLAVGNPIVLSTY